MPYYQLFYHIVWATKNRLPLLTPEIEPVVHGFLRSKAIGLEAQVYALNGMPDHVHLVATIPPKIAVAKFIGQVKAVASTRFNKAGTGGGPLFWQEEYSVFSFDRKRLPYVIAYVERQKEHHAVKTLIPVLERDEVLAQDVAGSQKTASQVREDRAGYFAGSPGSPGDQIAGLEGAPAEAGWEP